MSKVPPTGATQSLGNNANAALNKPLVSGSTAPKKDGTKPLAGVFAALRKSKQHKAYKALGNAKGNGPDQKSALDDEAVGR